MTNLEQLKEKAREEFDQWMESEFTETGGEISQTDFLDKLEEFIVSTYLAAIEDAEEYIPDMILTTVDDDLSVKNPKD